MKVLFMCTHNSCRSILSEAVFNHLAPEGMEAVSSGSFPSGRVNTRAIQTLKAAGIPTDGLSSKASDAFEGSPPDIVITVCDRAAGEACPIFFGPALKAHWGLADPSEATGSEAQIEAAFQQTLSKIQERVNAFISLPIATLSTEDLKTELARIGTL
ncbi:MULTISPECIES: arsenate reductase ArsC [Pseudomonas]|jgi:arsenate reductase (thioredoxin)|uniref:Arsenate reductase ArsC n=1 Tax=Pseudomonas kairouanensis TaxID=2293832 RepID=A0A4Z0AQ60_9PSED|nr:MULTISPECIES: arsenate reductase ArsC [Pseudomonas]MDU1662090.1 arsenate reductase ArsC [Stenotrophomonas maltophilia]PYC00161.1 arsenate reductase ArsC [Pseudomonas koreensis]PYC11661.1 arsenate reductase ArsC [Pseudomonas jessenii]RON60535.1 low molecular weight phosphatase family protein [Pseudomonas fluorescens]MBL7229899.1 arsenate reductase ArsC [Pseudomonas sp.]